VATAFRADRMTIFTTPLSFYVYFVNDNLYFCSITQNSKVEKQTDRSIQAVLMFLSGILLAFCCLFLSPGFTVLRVLGLCLAFAADGEINGDDDSCTVLSCW